jgi:hypothetical protein
MERPVSNDGCSNTIAGDPLSERDASTRQPQGDVNASTLGVQHIRTTIPLPWAIALEHVLADLRLTKVEALRESVALFLRYHGFGQGIPAPTAPRNRGQQ